MVQHGGRGRGEVVGEVVGLPGVRRRDRRHRDPQQRPGRQCAAQSRLPSPPLREQAQRQAKDQQRCCGDGVNVNKQTMPGLRHSWYHLQQT